MKENCIYWQIFACDGYTDCSQFCERHLQPGDRGAKILKDAYDEDLRQATIPIFEKWKKLFENGEI